MIRLRFAPSPTGYLHVGGARTALFNWLHARKHGGVFLLRIEDTDAERSSDEMVSGILSSLTWLGLDWDEGPGIGGPHAPYFQSQRIDRHKRAAERLVAEGHAYYCYCHPDDIAARREAAERTGSGWIYDRRCLSLPDDELRRHAEAGMPRAVRFRVPEGRTTFDDLVRGHIEIEHAGIEDFVILRSNGSPTYQLSVVVDDIDMEITDVVRGDDHISNTPKQILLYRALGADVPRFGHVPLILGPDKKRLSKRHGATSVGEYEALGYLPEAMINFLALLGWSPGGDREVFTREDLVSLFAIEDISGGNAVFNVEKLDWFNQQHILRMPAAEIARRLEGLVGGKGTGLVRASVGRTEVQSAILLRAIDLVKPRAKKLADIPPMLEPFFADSVTRDPAAVTKYLEVPGLMPHLAAWRNALASVEPFEPARLETALRELAVGRAVKPGVLIHATRVAVTGQAVSPGIFDVLALVGRERTLRRLDEVLAS